VVFVVSATAPLTESDCALLDAAAADTDAVIGVVTKIDVHRTWRDVLDGDRGIAAGHAARYAGMPWSRGRGTGPGRPSGDDLVAPSNTRWPTNRCTVEIVCARGKIA